MRAFGFTLLLLSAASIATACNDDSGSVCPPGYYLEAAQALCVPCPQGTPGYEVAQNQPVYKPPVNTVDTGGSGADATVGADIAEGGDTTPSGTDAATGPSLDTVNGSLTSDVTEGPGGEGDVVAGADGSVGGDDDAGEDPQIGGGDDATAGDTGGTGGTGGSGVVQDPPDSQSCGGCPLGFYCKTLPSGPFCVAGTCLSKPPVPVYTPPVADTGANPTSDTTTGADGTGGEADSSEDDSGTP